MKRVLSVVVLLGGTLLLVAAVTAGVFRPSATAAPARAEGGGEGGTTITVVEHASTDATTDTGAAGDSAGDLLTFANDVFDADDKQKVGTDQGYCLRVVPGVSFECTWTTILKGGQIVVAGPFYDKKESTLAITGGTGRFAKARGTMHLSARDNGKKFVFAFHITR
jgi:allene oxide cyclase